MICGGEGELGKRGGKGEDQLGSVAVGCLQIFTQRCGNSYTSIPCADRMV